MDEQILIEEKAHFYTEKKDYVDNYSREKKKTRIHSQSRIGSAKRLGRFFLYLA